MAELVIDDLRNGYVDLINFVLSEGEEVSPRGQLTKEIRNCTVVLTNPVDAIPIGVGRKLNMKIGAVETTQLIAGVSAGMQLNSVSNNSFEAYMNNGRLIGAYGPRLYHQLPTVIEALSDDHETRQAAALVWRNNELDLAMLGNKDVPCTVALSWNIRNGKLNASTIMRSNDVFLGVAYDFWMFTRLQMALAWSLNLEVGDYRHHAISMHAYQRDWHKVDEFDINPEKPAMPPSYTGDSDIQVSSDGIGFEEALSRWEYVRSMAQAVVNGTIFTTHGNPSVGASWYGDLLRDHAATGLMCSMCRYYYDLDSKDARHIGLVKQCAKCNPQSTILQDAE